MDTALLQKYIAGDANTEEKQHVAEWIDASPDNRREYIAQRKLYDIQVWYDKEGEEEKSPKTVAKKRMIYPIIRELVKIAAVFVLAYTLFIQMTPEQEFQTLYVPEGQRAELKLSDGTEVWLNAKTRFTYPSNFNKKNRTVQLDGEAYFSVTENKKKPFVVQTNRHEITVLGTEFNVIAYKSNDYFETSLLKGSVQIKSPDAATYRIEPNTKIYTKGGILCKESIKDTDYFLWRDGLICFDDETVEQIFNKLELYYDVELIIEKKSLLPNRYTGKFRTKEGVEQVLKVLKLKHHFKYQKIEESNIIRVY